METMEIEQSAVTYPADWQEVGLGTIAKVSSGGTPSRENPAYWNGTIPWLTTSAINFNTITQADEFITEAALKNSAAKIFAPGTLLIAMYGQGATRGRVARLAFPAATNQACAAITVTGADTDFVYYSLLMRYDEIRNSGQGGNQKNLNAGLIRSIKIGLPPINEQRRIVEVLSSLTKAIGDTENLLAAKLTYKRGLMQQLLTGQRRFPEFQGQPLPLRAIGEMITESRESLPVSNPHERITVRLNLNGVEARDVRGTEAEDATVYYLRRAGQFIYGKQNLHKGAMGIIPAELDGYSSTQDMPTFDFADTVHPQWFLYLMSREDFYPTLEKISTGTGSKRIQPASLYKIEVPSPSLPEQQRIAAVLSAYDQETELLQAQLRQWQQQKKGLMQQLLTGRLRVPTM